MSVFSTNTDHPGLNRILVYLSCLSSVAVAQPLFAAQNLSSSGYSLRPQRKDHW